MNLTHEKRNLDAQKCKPQRGGMSIEALSLLRRKPQRGEMWDPLKIVQSLVTLKEVDLKSKWTTNPVPKTISAES